MIIRKKDILPFDFSGLSIREYTASLSEKSSFAVIQVPPKASHRLSWSKRSDKYYYVLQGCISFSIDGEDHILNEGDFCFLRKGRKFKYENTTEEPASLILVHTPHFILDEEVFE